VVLGRRRGKLGREAKERLVRRGEDWGGDRVRAGEGLYMESPLDWEGK